MSREAVMLASLKIAKKIKLGNIIIIFLTEVKKYLSINYLI